MITRRTQVYVVLVEGDGERSLSWVENVYTAKDDAIRARARLTRRPHQIATVHVYTVQPKGAEP